jgi:hypothetical protein
VFEIPKDQSGVYGRRFEGFMQGCAGMKGRRIARKKIRSFGNQQVRREMRNFLRALNSYPDYFSKHPGISFEQHHGRIVEAAKNTSRRSASNGH